MNKPIILIVEDDFALMRGLTDIFYKQGFEIKTAMDGEVALQIATTEEVDVIVLDIMLPKLNGYRVCQGIRQAERDVPIIMLTSKGQESDIVRGLNLGADDYVTKPFSMVELLARVNAFLRKKKVIEQYHFADYDLDMTSRKLHKGDSEIPLTPKEFGLLAFFVQREGQALTRDTILNLVWNGSLMTTTRSVDRCVTTLRRKLGDDPSSPVFIKSVRNIGYRFESLKKG